MHVNAKIWWCRRGPLGRMAKLIDEGPGGAPARTIHPGSYGMVPWFRWMRWAVQNARGRARQLLRIWSRQWQAVIHLAVIASTEWDQIARSQRGMLVRAGEEIGVKTLYGERVRNAGVQPAQTHSSPSTEILCPAAFSLQVPGRLRVS